MKTYISQSPARATERNLINTVGQSKKQQFNFTDNRPVAVNQRKTLQSMGQQKPMQMMKTDTEMVQHDLLDSSTMRRRFFRLDTRNQLRDVTSYSIDQGFLPVNYEHLDGDYINTKAKLENWLDSDNEKIYVWQGGQLIGGNNPGGDDKICHPNLIGGNPDVDYAGTIVPGTNHWHVTRDSGHFQPGPDDTTRQQIADQMNNLCRRQHNPLFLPH